MKEELKEYFESEEGKEFFETTLDGYAKDKGYVKPEDVTGLVNKNRELLKKLKDAKEKSSVIPEDKKKLLDILEEKDIFDSEELESAFETKSKESPPESDKRIKRLEKQLKDFEDEKNNAIQKANAERQARINFQREAVLTKALKENNVKPKLFKAAFALFDSETKIEELEDGSINFVANSELGLPINEHISEWSKTEDAQDFIQQPVNSGSGGSLHNSKGRDMTKAEFDKLSPSEKIDTSKQFAAGEKNLIE